MRVFDLFSGIGGFSLGLEAAGMETVGFCEIEEFPRKILKKHWPNVPIFKDIRTLTGEEIREKCGRIDLVCGGYPCQPFSNAGKRRGHEDDRHLWPEMFRLIKEVRPTWVIGENVAGLTSMVQFDSLLEVDTKEYSREEMASGSVAVGRVCERKGTGMLYQVLEDLEQEGYSVQPFVIPACAVDAPHRRDRVWIVGHASRNRGGCGKPRNHAKQVGGNILAPTRREQSSNQTARPSEILADTSSRRLQGGQKQSCHEEIGPKPHDKQFGGLNRGTIGTMWDAEPYVGGGLDGFSVWLDGLDMTQAHNYIKTYGDETNQRPEEILRLLRRDNGAETFQRQAGGQIGISSEEVLFSYLCQLEKKTQTLGNLSLAGKKIQKRSVRGLRSKDQSPCLSHRPKHQKQFTRKPANSLQALSQFLAHASEKAWTRYRGADAETSLKSFSSDWELGIARVADGVPKRVDRLKCLGSAVVSQVVEQIGKAIMETQTASLYDL